METDELFTRLTLAEQRVQADLEQVARLEKLIADFEFQDMKTWADQARKLLLQFEDLRTEHVAERDLLRARLFRVRA